MTGIVIDVSAAVIEAWATDPAGPVVLLMGEKAALVEELAKKNAPKGATGELEESIHANPPVVTGSRIEVEVVADAPYALYVHEGTKPHEIRPRNGRVLAWEGPEGPAFSTVVHHPGTTAQPFLRDALEGAI